MAGVLGFIPARGGSKTIPRKNLRVVAARPLLAYTVEAAQVSQRLTRVVTSTDDEDIASAARRLGCEVVMRPTELGGDETPMGPVVRHALGVLESAQGRFEHVAVLQPTAPLRTAEDIDQALELLQTSGADSVVSVYQVGDHHPSRMYQMVDGRLAPYAPEPANRLRQSLPALYHRNGAIYACRRALLDGGDSLIGQDVRAYIMPRARSLNIDDEYDLLLAELLLRHQRGAAVGAEASDAHPQR